MNYTKVGRPAKAQLRCKICQSVCPPKGGDWFFSVDSDRQQVFLCKRCELENKEKFKRAIPSKD